MLVVRRQMKVEIENLEARAQMVAAAQASNVYSFDESQLGRVKELVHDLRTRLDISEKMANSEGLGQDEIPLADSTPTNITEQINAHFSETKPNDATKTEPKTLAQK
jgi:hypothetical protein